MSQQVAEEVFRLAASSIEVLPPPYDAVVDTARQQRGRRRRITALSVAAVVAAVGAGTWVSARPDPPPEPPKAPSTHPVAVHNPIDTWWYADGRLHLHGVELDLPGVTDLAATGAGVGYLDGKGSVGTVDAAGKVALVGSAQPGSTVLGSSLKGWAAWVEPGTGRDRIVVWSVGVGEQLGTLPVAAGTRLVAIDQGRVYYANDSGAFDWSPVPVGTWPEPLGPPVLADVGTATRVYQRARRIEMVQPFFSVSFVRTGQGASVSPGGNFVLTRRPGPWVPGTPYSPLVYDTRSGQRLRSGIAPDERVVDAAFGQNQNVAYLVVHVADLAGANLDGGTSPLLVLRSCHLDTGACQDVVPVRNATGPALFAEW